MQCIAINWKFFDFLLQRNALVDGHNRITVVWMSLKAFGYITSGPAYALAWKEEELGKWIVIFVLGR